MSSGAKEFGDYLPEECAGQHGIATDVFVEGKLLVFTIGCPGCVSEGTGEVSVYLAVDRRIAMWPVVQEALGTISTAVTSRIREFKLPDSPPGVDVTVEIDLERGTTTTLDPSRMN